MSEVQREPGASTHPPGAGHGKLARGRLNTLVIILLVMAIVAPIGGASGPVSSRHRSRQRGGHAGRRSSSP